MSKASTSHSGRSGNPKVAGSSLDIVVLNAGRVKPMSLQLILVTLQTDARHY